MDEKKLVETALAARKNAYAPYSGFCVGAALLCDDERVFNGCNVECAAFGAGICAERSAISNAVTSGAGKFKMLAVAGGGKGYCFPCGICRQLLREFASELKILCANENGEYEVRYLSALLPDAFDSFSSEK